VTIRVPEDRVDDLLGFYRGVLGFEVEGLDAYEAGERPIFAIRLSETSVVHVVPSETFETPADEHFDHFAVVVEEPIEEIEATLDDAGVEIERQFTPAGATGTAPAVYVRDPVGYQVELKTAIAE
jgi:catechol 2,3-dioxygenase-like lactoylglutathione lyase family enzyme